MLDRHVDVVLKAEMSALIDYSLCVDVEFSKRTEKTPVSKHKLRSRTGTINSEIVIKTMAKK